MVGRASVHPSSIEEFEVEEVEVGGVELGGLSTWQLYMVNKLCYYSMRGI